MQSSTSASGLRVAKWKHAIIGGVVDDRGKAAVEFVARHAMNVHELSYNPETIQITFDGTAMPSEEIEDVLRALAPDSVVLEASTLGFVEVFLCCRELLEQQGDVSIVYAEPKRYRRPDARHVLRRRDFGLTDVVEPFTGVPGAAMMLREPRKVRTVFLLGYEGQRLEQALEQTDLVPSRCSVVFGVPAFQAGWEMDAFANNVPIIKERQLSRQVLFAGAQNPGAAYGAIRRVHETCRGDERLLIAPIGTKPHGIGAALYACFHNEVGILYDHPRRSSGRSEDVATWHLFDASRG